MVRRSNAFTLVELLVVISIIAVLMGLLLPAVQSAREAGRRTTCSNNLYQLAFACIRHNDTNGYLPGWRNELRWTSGASSGTSTPSWPVMILPFMERTDIFKAWQANANPSTPYVSFFVCPSSPPESLNSPTLAYAGNCGTGSNAVGQRFDGVMVDNTATGTLRYRSSLETVSEGDGSAMTLMLSEKCHSATPAFVQGRWDSQPQATFIFNNGNATISDPPRPVYVAGFGIGASAIPNPPKIINSTVIGPPGQVSQPSSNHPGGVVVGFCDGRAGFLKDSLTASVYAQLLSPDHNVSTNQWNASSAHPLSEGLIK